MWNSNPQLGEIWHFQQIFKCANATWTRTVKQCLQIKQVGQTQGPMIWLLIRPFYRLRTDSCNSCSVRGFLCPNVLLCIQYHVQWPRLCNHISLQRKGALQICKGLGFNTPLLGMYSFLEYYIYLLYHLCPFISLFILPNLLSLLIQIIWSSVTVITLKIVIFVITVFITVLFLISALFFSFNGWKIN